MIQIQVGDKMVDVKLPPLGGAGLAAIFGAIVLITGLYTSVYQIDTEEAGVVLRFGKHIDTVPSGLHFCAPFGIDQVQKVPVTRKIKQEFGFGTEGNENKYQWSSPSEWPLEKSMVTGDLNSAQVEWIIQYTITNPEDFSFKVRNPDTTLRHASEAVMREVVGDRTVDEVITVGRQDIEIEAREKLNILVNLYEMGITVDQLQLINVKPPREVEPSFNEVNKAEQEKDKTVNIAKGEFNRAVPKASGEAEKMISEAEGYAIERINEAEGDAAKFTALYKEYLKAPEVTRRRIYLETMEKVMPRIGKKVIIDEQANQVLPLLPLNQLTK